MSESFVLIIQRQRPYPTSEHVRNLQQIFHSRNSIHKFHHAADEAVITGRFDEFQAVELAARLASYLSRVPIDRAIG